MPGDKRGLGDLLETLLIYVSYIPSHRIPPAVYQRLVEARAQA